MCFVDTTEGYDWVRFENMIQVFTEERANRQWDNLTTDINTNCTLRIDISFAIIQRVSLDSM